MGKINCTRVILGGLLAGLVLNIGEFLLNDVLFAKQIEEMLKRLNLPTPGGSFIAIAVVITFVLGIVIVATYAMMRPRSGPGPKTAIYAAIVAWFCVYVYSGILNSAIFGVTPGLLIMGIAWGFGEYVLAGLAGAWIYKES